MTNERMLELALKIQAEQDKKEQEGVVGELIEAHGSNINLKENYPDVERCITTPKVYRSSRPLHFFVGDTVNWTIIDRIIEYISINNYQIESVTMSETNYVAVINGMLLSGVNRMILSGVNILTKTIIRDNLLARDWIVYKGIKIFKQKNDK